MLEAHQLTAGQNLCLAKANAITAAQVRMAMDMAKEVTGEDVEDPDDPLVHALLIAIATNYGAERNSSRK